MIANAWGVNASSERAQPIGAIWAHADSKGFSQRIDYLPLVDCEIVIRVAGDKQAEAGADA